MSDKQPEALRIAAKFEEFNLSIYPLEQQAVAELRRLHALNAELVRALEALDACYCEASDEMSRAQRTHHRLTLTNARDAVSKAKES